MSTRVLLADDHKIMRDGLCALLEKEAGFIVVGVAENGRDAVRLARELRPDVVVMDISMPDLNGIEATRQISADVPGVKVIALSMHSERRFVTGMLEAGATGYVLKGAAFEELVASIRAVRANRIFTSPKITDALVQGYVRELTQPEPTPRSPLTGREREVLQLLAEGRGTRKIAEELHVSVNTVDTHRRHIMEKLGLRSIAELTKYAIRAGLTSLHE